MTGAILAIDTSAAVSVAVLRADGEVVEFDSGTTTTPGLVTAGGRLASNSARRRHAEDLPPMITDALAAARLHTNELSAVAVGTGPGPYTGLRVGVAAAQALGFALGTPVYGVSSLDALAAAAAVEAALPVGAEVVATLDARRREIFWARYIVAVEAGPDSLAPVGPAQVGPATELAAELAARPAAALCGEGAALYGSGLALSAPGASGETFEPLLPSALFIASLAKARAGAGRPQPAQPIYLRQPDVMPR